MGGGFGVWCSSTWSKNTGAQGGRGWGVWGLVFFDLVEEYGRGGRTGRRRRRGGGSELLHVVQLAVVAVKGEELGVCAALYNRAVVYDANHVGVLYR